MLTRAMNNVLVSWNARTVSCVLGVRGVEGGIDVRWRRPHRAEHAALDREGVSMSNMGANKMHRRGGKTS